MRFLQGTISFPEIKWKTAEERAAANTPLLDFVDKLASVGADGIELWGHHLDDLSEADVEALAAKIKETGQQVEVLSPYWDFSSSDEAVEKSLADARRYLGLKDVFGVEMIRVFVGAPASAESTSENWDRAANGLGRLVEMYDGSLVTFVVETHGNQLSDTPESSLRLIKAVNEPTMRINYQNMGGEAAEELDLVYPLVEHAHVSNVKKWTSKMESVVKELFLRGHDGAVTVEFCRDSLPGEGEEFDREKAIEGMRADIAALRALVE